MKRMNGVQSLMNSLLKLGVAVDVKQSDELLPVKSE